MLIPVLPMPVVDRLDGVDVVRDDLIPGGTKTRYLSRLVAEHDEVVYATPAYGGAQLALAYSARALGKRATLVVADRRELHPRTREAEALGARIIRVAPGYLARCQDAARAYAERSGAHLVAFGGESPAAIRAIGEAMFRVWCEHGPYDEVWCAAGSGVLARGLQRGVMMAVGPGALPRFVAVQVGRKLGQADAGAADIIVAPEPYEKATRAWAPFPSCPHYDAKAWAICQRRRRGVRTLFWNVIGPSPTPFAAALMATGLAEVR